MTEKIKEHRAGLLRIFVVGMLTACVTNGRAQNLVVDGSFETPYVTNATKDMFTTNMPPWQTTATNFEIWTNGWENGAAGVGPCFSADGTQNLEIISSGVTNATVWQTMPTVAGERYFLRFYYSPRPKSASDLFAVSINSNQIFSAVEDGDGLTNFNWQMITTNFVAVSNMTTLAFSDASLDNGGAGTHIDGVLLEHVPRLTIGAGAGGGLAVSWLGVSNEIYQLQSRTDLVAGGWGNVGSAVVGTNSTISISVSADWPQEFYRVVTGP